jgi:Flp pilus assembly protein TadG
MTGKLKSLALGLRKDATGSTVIETAIVAPVLIAMTLGTFDVSQMLAKQHHLQSGAGDTESIVLAVAAGTATNATTVKTALASSLGLPESKITVELVYRCNWQTTLSTTNSCGSGAKVSTYVRVTFTDTYTPMWTKFRVGSAMTYSVKRTVQVS